MKKILKALIPSKLIQGIQKFQYDHFPNAAQKQAKLEEKEMIARCKKFYAGFLKKDDLCFDVGANMGNRIGPLLEAGAKVVAVEPQKSCYKYLQKKFGNSIQVVTKGMSDKEEVKKFYISNASTISSFSEEWISAVKNDRFKGYNWNKVEEIEMTTLDKLISDYGVPAFIKIDVEGYELSVIKGLHSPVKLISFEYTAPEQLQVAIDCIDYIHQVNSNIECNYSAHETFELSLPQWLSAGQMKEYILSKPFIDSGFGDIYLRSK